MREVGYTHSPPATTNRSSLGNGADLVTEDKSKGCQVEGWGDKFEPAGLRSMRLLAVIKSNVGI